MKENKQGYGEQGPLLLRKKYPLLPHLREEGLQAIVNIRASLNLGLSEKQLFQKLYLFLDL